MADRKASSSMKSLKILIVLVAALLQTAAAFRAAPHHVTLSLKKTPQRTMAIAKFGPHFHKTHDTNRVATTRLSMYNLPPSGGGGGGNSQLADIAKGVLGLVLVIGFFASPLGGFVLGLFNSLLLLSILAPILITLAFQGWQYFNTIDAPCPNCSAPVKALKSNSDGEAAPTVCYNCGAILQANYDNTGIDNITGKNSVLDDNGMYGTSIFDLFGGGANGFGGGGDEWSTTTTTTTTTTIVEDEPAKKAESRRKREQTVIDVEIEGDDRPWQ